MEKHIQKVKVTDFGKRHFDPKFGGTKITDISVEEFEAMINSELNVFYKVLEGRNILSIVSDVKKIIPGYADFCKLVCLKNKTSARTGSMPIAIENYQYLRSGFSSRTPSELPVMDRWFELPLPASKAEYLMVVIYSREQLLKEHEEDLKKKFKNWEETRNETLSESDKKSMCELDGFKFDLSEDDEWGVVAILGQMSSDEEPMKPITMMRNALGMSEGGSGVPIDKERYAKSVEFWSKNATVK